MTPTKSYTTFEAAKLLKYTPQAVIKWCNKGMLKSSRSPGGHRRIIASEIIRFKKRYNLI